MLRETQLPREPSLRRLLSLHSSLAQHPEGFVQFSHVEGAGTVRVEAAKQPVHLLLVEFDPKRLNPQSEVEPADFPPPLGVPSLGHFLWRHEILLGQRLPDFRIGVGARRDRRRAAELVHFHIERVEPALQLERRQHGRAVEGLEHLELAPPPLGLLAREDRGPCALRLLLCKRLLQLQGQRQGGRRGRGRFCW